MTFRDSLFSLSIFGDFERSAGPDVGNVSFSIGFQWFAHGVDDGLARIIVFPKDFQWFDGSTDSDVEMLGMLVLQLVFNDLLTV